MKQPRGRRHQPCEQSAATTGWRQGFWQSEGSVGLTSQPTTSANEVSQRSAGCQVGSEATKGTGTGSPTNEGLPAEPAALWVPAPLAPVAPAEPAVPGSKLVACSRREQAALAATNARPSHQSFDVNAGPQPTMKMH